MLSWLVTLVLALAAAVTLILWPVSPFLPEEPVRSIPLSRMV